MLVYTDGSCSNKKGGYAFIVINDKDVVEKYDKMDGECTNNIAELTAIYQALLYVKDLDEKIIIRSDSEYAILSLTQYLKKWKLNGYKTANNQPIKNKALILSIDALLTTNIKFEHVRAHQGEQYNERADYLANLGRKLIDNL